MTIAALAPAVTTLRLSLHVVAACVWVGGQLVLAGLLPTVQSLGPEAPRRVASAFGRIQWPAFVVLLATGIWNILADHAGQSRGWNVVLSVKVAVVLLAGVAAGLHQRSRSKVGLAVFGGVAALASLAALVLGVLLSG